MKVYVIRHGESETNLQKRWTGWADVQLTEKGREDARRVGELLRDVAFDKVYTSDLSRAIETAKEAIPGCTYETDTLLREINVGTLAKMPLSTPTDEERERIAKYGYVDFGGETREELSGRINEFIKRLEELNCENVALFSHAGWLCGMLNAVLGTTISRKHLCCNNCTMGIFEYTDGVWRLYSWINVN